jgi:hypothetical protein
MYIILDVDYRLCMTWIIYQQLSGYKVEKKLHLGVRKQKKKVEYHSSKLYNRELRFWAVTSEGTASIMRKVATYTDVNETQASSGIH